MTTIVISIGIPFQTRLSITQPTTQNVSYNSNQVTYNSNNVVFTP